MDKDATDELYRLLNEDDERYADDMAAFAERTEPPVVWKTLSDFGPGDGRRILSLDAPSAATLKVLSDWGGPAGHVEVVRGRGDDDDYYVMHTVERAALANVSVVGAADVKPGAYDLVFANRVLYWEPSNPGKRDAYLEWMRSLIAPGGGLVMMEFDFSGWQYIPEAPAIRELNERCQSTFDFAFDAALMLPECFEQFGLTPTLRSFTAALPANSWLGYKPISRGRAFVATGQWAAQDNDVLIQQAQQEFEDPDRWVIHPTVVIASALVPA